jgi:hypothetical protein
MILRRQQHQGPKKDRRLFDTSDLQRSLRRLQMLHPQR